jgi:hypothetical protein
MPLAAVDLTLGNSTTGGKIARLAELRELLAEKFPASELKRGSVLATGFAPLDAQCGGLQRGAVTEFTGSPGSGSLFLEAMLNAVCETHCFAALIDGGRSFDPQERDPAALARMLWVLCDSARQAVKAADLLLRDGNLPLILLDLQPLPMSELRRIPASTWHRFHRLVEQTTTAFVVLSLQPMVEGARVRLAVRRHWNLNAMRQRRRVLLEDLDLQVFARPGFSTAPEPERKTA